MAFVRWRGRCAQLLATEYDHGRTRQRCLANLRGGYVVPQSTRAAIAAQYPEYTVDWEQIDRALAAGPPGAQPLSTQQLSWLEVEGRLREWAETPGILFREAQTLRDAAETLTHWRAQEPGGNLP